MNYYYLKNGETLGPLPIDDLIKIIDENTMIWNEDGSMKDWLLAKEVGELAKLFKEQNIPNIINNLPKTEFKRENKETVKTNKFNHWKYLLIILCGIIFSECIIDSRLNFYFKPSDGYIHVDLVLSGMILLITILFWIINYKKHSNVV